MESHSAFARALRQHRHDRGLTQFELAERAGLSERAISDLERGLKSPQRATVRALVTALDLAFDQVEGFEMSARSMPPTADPPGDRVSNNLPVALTSFIGREQTIVDLQQRIGDPVTGMEARLITLTGAGGCGKTRLSIQVARRLLDAFPDGITFVDLSPITDGRLVPLTILTALGVREGPGQAALEVLLRFTQNRSMLLVLDNCEHLVQTCAELVDALLRSTTRLRILATSRELLRVPGEVAWRVPSLNVPDSTASLEPRLLLEHEAARLFVDRIRLVQPGFGVDAHTGPAVAQVCSRLDGIPLAIELAAARGVAMTAQDIAARLDDCFHLLTGGSRVALPRHRTLEATIDWSHQLLAESEQILFRRLAVFAGGWTLDAAQDICADAPLAPKQILDALLRLVDQSLVSFHEQGSTMRYRFLETVRVYASNQLEESGEASRLRTLHRDWYLSFAERAALGLGGAEQNIWFRRLVTEHDNLRAALETCRTNADDAHAELRLAAALGQFWRLQHPTEGRRRLSEALSRVDTTASSTRAEALIWLASIESLYGDPEVGRQLAEASLANARAVGDDARAAHALRQLAIVTRDDDPVTRTRLLTEGLAFARSGHADGEAAMLLAFLAAVAAEAGELQGIGTLLAEAIALAERSQDAFAWVQPLFQVGWLAVIEGRLDDAEREFQQMLRLAERIGYDASIGYGFVALGQVALRRGWIGQARDLHLRALLTLRAAGGAYLASALVYLSAVEMADGQPERAQRLLGASEAWHVARGGAQRVWLAVTHGPLKRGLVEVAPVPEDPALLRAREEGRSMSLEEAVAWAIQPIGDNLQEDPETARATMSPTL